MPLLSHFDYRFAVAPHFYMQSEWSRRLQSGVTGESSLGPCPSWRSLTPDELAVLVWSKGQPLTAKDLEDCVCLFQLPGHLCSTWWKMLEQGAAELAAGSLPGFESFVSQIAEFLAFKELPIPAGARCNAIVSAVVPSVVLGEKRVGEPQLWGLINLGDKETAVVLSNSRTVGRGSDSPLLRLTLGPGEGCRLPGKGLLLNYEPSGQVVPGVQLWIFEGLD